MSDQTPTHYDVEDIPPSDADTQVALYEQAREVIAHGLEDGHRLLKNLEVTLHQIFVEAENANDAQLMTMINDSWERVQSMAAIMGQQGAALGGANNAIDALKEQRDAIAKELNSLIKSINEADVDDPRLEELHQTIQEWEMEYADTYMWDTMNDEVTEHLKDLFGEFKPHRGIFMLAYDLVAALRGDRRLTDRQNALIVELAKSFDVAPVKDGDS